MRGIDDPARSAPVNRGATATVASGAAATEAGKPSAPADAAPVLVFDAVDVAIDGTRILHDISFELHAGRTLGIVGESGSGKSMTALAAMRLLPRGSLLTGSIHFEGRDLVTLDEHWLQSIRGGDIGMVFQEPMTALNPVHTVGRQVEESLRLHRGVSRREAMRLAAETLARVELPTARYSPHRYPHELSGGQRQRVVIAIAIACGPRLLIADEPTTALDVTTQAGILRLLKQLQHEDGLSLILISHDLAVVAEMADELAVMRDGRIVDRGAYTDVFAPSATGYTRSLLQATVWEPDHGAEATAVPAAPDATDLQRENLLEVIDLVCSHAGARRSLFGPRERIVAVDGVSLTIHRGESVGLVGESGCGKSTLARALLGLGGIDGGQIRYRGDALVIDTGPGQAATVPRALRREIQVVFQDPYGSFDPRHRVERLVAEPLHLLDERSSKADQRRRVVAMLERVGLDGSILGRYIHEFSGGQRQRIAIARALIVRPSLVILDEAVSALDVSVRAQVLALLAELATDEGLAYLFISHDLSVVRRVTDRLYVMKSGRIVEAGSTDSLFEAPGNAYTQELIAAIPLLPSFGVKD